MIGNKLNTAAVSRRVILAVGAAWCGLVVAAAFTRCGRALFNHNHFSGAAHADCDRGFYAARFSFIL